MFEEYLIKLPSSLSEIDLCPPPECFSSLPTALRERLFRRERAALATPLPPIKASDWLRFSRDGNRRAFESLYFARRRRLSDLACGTWGRTAFEQNRTDFSHDPLSVARFGDSDISDSTSPSRPHCSHRLDRSEEDIYILKDHHLDALFDTIWAICEESAWQLPAHNSYFRDAAQLAWPDVNRPIIDLFAAETGALLACTCALLRNTLPAPLIARVQQEIERRLLTPYLTCHFWWMGKGKEEMNNWTPWCTQNILLCAFALPFSEKQRRRVIARALRSLDCFIKDYAEDGCCSEGAQYYSHAALCLFGCLELLCSVAPGSFEGLFQEEKIRNMAAYIYHVHISGSYYVNFADCSPLCPRRGVREFLFGKRCSLPELASFAAHDWQTGLDEKEDGQDIARINLWYQLLELRNCSSMLRVAREDPPPVPGDHFYPGVGLFLSRKGSWFLGAKAGNNADSHNHNDTGSVVLYKDGRPFLIDLGVETYTKKTFSPERYEIWTMQSSWHNLPSFDDIQQEAGQTFRARHVQIRTEDTFSEMSAELSAAWPPAAKLHRYLRQLILTQEGLDLCDECEGEYKKAECHLLFCEKPNICGNFITIGNMGFLYAKGATGELSVDAVPIRDPLLLQSWPETVYRLRIPFLRRIDIHIRGGSLHSDLRSCSEKTNIP